ncbi:T9SS type A sorting domain-containing protein [Flavobacterium sp. W22_SRS_FP1]|uniref:T9SS type A sorting domain-containing protein n=1 Tax=Flavobacterium sp. W22_SRS_FP1 TaxID=3240276 RepID=UPI003F93456F
MTISQKIKSSLPYFLFLSSIFTGNMVHSQIKNNGDLHIGDNSALHINGETFDFGSGTITTSRTNFHYGVLSMSDGSYWAGASETYFVDGYVQTHSTAAFVLPVGQSGVYAPIQVTSSNSVGVDAAYFRSPANTLGTVFDESISAISTVEYWDIKSEGAKVDISLSWSSSSDISDLTSSSLINLTIVGYNGSAWVIIPSMVDEYSILGEISNLGYGSISSNKEIDISAYSAFSLGTTTTKQLSVAQFEKVELMAYLNNNRLSIKASLPITALIVYDMTGKKIVSQRLNADLKYDIPFSHADGMYIARIELDNGASLITRKIINKN